MSSYTQKRNSINVHLAKLFSELGVNAFVEKIVRPKKLCSDVMFQLGGLRVVFETKLEDSKSAKDKVYENAHHQINANNAHIAVALVYPQDFTIEPTKAIANRLASSLLKYRIVSEKSADSKWKIGTPESIMKAVRKTQENLVKEKFSKRTVNLENEEWEGIVNQIEAKSFAVDLYESDDLDKIPVYFAKLRKNILTKEEQSKLKVGSMVNIKILKNMLPEKKVVYELDAKLQTPPKICEDAITDSVRELEDLFESIN